MATPITTPTPSQQATLRRADGADDAAGGQGAGEAGLPARHRDGAAGDGGPAANTWAFLVVLGYVYWGFQALGGYRAR